jgi:predicted NBD/HSP70 family sugar kinase
MPQLQAQPNSTTLCVTPVYGFINLIVNDFKNPQRQPIDAVSIAAAGPVKDGRVLGTNTGAYGDGKNNLAEDVAKHFKNTRVFVVNDADAMALGEATPKGAMPNAANGLGLIVGTGVGAGKIHNGQLAQSNGASIGEIGHTVILADGLHDDKSSQQPCRTFEDVASGPGLVRLTQYYAQDFTDNRSQITPEQVIAKAKQVIMNLEYIKETQPNNYSTAQNTEAILSPEYRAYLAWHKYLAIGIANELYSHFVPNVVINGGLSPFINYDELTTQVKASLAVLPREQVEQITIQQAKLGDTAALIGAARWAVDQLHLRPQPPTQSRIL